MITSSPTGCNTLSNPAADLKDDNGSVVLYHVFPDAVKTSKGHFKLALNTLKRLHEQDSIQPYHQPPPLTHRPQSGSRGRRGRSGDSSEDEDDQDDEEEEEEDEDGEDEEDEEEEEEEDEDEEEEEEDMIPPC